MTILELHSLILASCPIFSVDSNGVISFDPAATPQQQQAAQNIVNANLSKLNGQPSRISLDALAIFNYLKPSAGNLTAAQQNQVALACAAVVLAQNPPLAARINAALGLNIPYEQANPNG